jgi:hypothetical protein
LNEVRNKALRGITSSSSKTAATETEIKIIIGLRYRHITLTVLSRTSAFCVMQFAYFTSPGVMQHQIRHGMRKGSDLFQSTVLAFV